MRSTPRIRFIGSALLLSSLWLACGGTSFFESHLLRLLHEKRESELLTAIKKNPEKVRHILSQRMEAWAGLAAHDLPSEQAEARLRDTLMLARLLGTFTKNYYEDLFREHLLRLLQAQRERELAALMRQDADAVRDLLSRLQEEWRAQDEENKPVEASRTLAVLLNLAHGLDALTGDNQEEFHRWRASRPREQRRALSAAERCTNKTWELMRQQQFDQALESIGQAAAINRDLQDPYLRADLHNLRGKAFVYLKRYREAEEQYEKARELLVRLHSRSALAFVDSELGLLAVKGGRPSDAFRLYNRALAEQRRLLSPRYAATTLTRLGALYIKMGDLRKGLEKHQEALALEKAIQDPWTQLDTLNNIGQAYYLQKDYERAQQFYQRALALGQGRKDATMGLVLSNLGELYAQIQQRDRALDYLNQALRLKSELPNRSPYDVAWTLRALAEIYWLNRQWREADEYAAKALCEMANSQTRTPPEAVLRSTIYNLQGRLLREQGRLAEAAAAFERALQGIEDELANLEADHWKTSLLSSIQDLYHDMIALQHDGLKEPVSAFACAEKARARAFLDLISGQIQVDYGDELAGDRPQRVREVLATVHAEPGDWASLKGRLPPDVTVIEYTVTKDRLWIWVLDADGVRARTVTIAQDRLNQYVQSFYDAVTLGRDFMRSHPSWQARLTQTRARGAELYRHLIEPVRGLIPQGRTLCFVPDGHLYYVPFAALVDPARQKYLIEEHTIFYAPSASILTWALGQQRRKATGKPLLVVSNPEIGPDIQAEHPYLQPLDAEEFDDEIVRAYRGAALLRGAAADKATVLASMGDYEIVHFSTHSILDDKDPLHSSLIVAPGAGPAVRPESAARLTPDGQLFTHEIFRLKLSSTRLLTLSACETALGELWHGEGMVGMARAVFSAGVPSLIVTQWRVEDRSAGRLMAAFYKQLRAQPNIAVALARAQLDYAQGVDLVRNRHPYYWGGFCLMGATDLR